MKIYYECARCDKMVEAVVYLANFKNRKNKGLMKRLDCLECGRYIKFIGDKELNDIDPKWRDKTDFKEKERLENEIDLEEINFKLDLILDHLGVKNGM